MGAGAGVEPVAPGIAEQVEGGTAIMTASAGKRPCGARGRRGEKAEVAK